MSDATPEDGGGTAPGGDPAPAAGSTAAGGGGGGGGGGGATKNVNNCALGSSSVNIRGTANMTRISRQLKTKELVVARALRLFCVPNSSRLSANIARGGRGGPNINSAEGKLVPAARLAACPCWTCFTSGS